VSIRSERENEYDMLIWLGFDVQSEFLRVEELRESVYGKLRRERLTFIAAGEV
jgi:hypothetical protein